MNKKLKGKVAIVTGSGANIGEACVKALAAEGASVVVADINREGAERVAAEINDSGGRALAGYVDLLDEKSVETLVAASLEHFGRIDILHNNAADTRPAQMAADASITELDGSVWDAAFAVNARGTMLMTKHCLPAMIAAGGGSIINTSSGVSILGDIFTPAYSASKGAVNSFTRNTATQFGKQNIRCNAVLPGLILTDLSRSMVPEDQLAMLEKHTLLPRLGNPNDIARTVVFLASDDASFITGQLFAVDGGISTHQPFVGDVLASMV
ncbi:MAG: dehydrogenase [Porticoccaceae bacterium]|nr:dehydrogenase [Porticoccaceae bacterium]